MNTENDLPEGFTGNRGNTFVDFLHVTISKERIGIGFDPT